jgi:hypothetical protein
MTIRRPATTPCTSCPYRRDVPSGVWDPREYVKLVDYDEPTWAQPAGLFLCHLKSGRVCAGWAGCHDTAGLFALRLAACTGQMSPDELAATLDYTSPVPLWGSGRDAAAHGLADVADPGAAARTMADRLSRRLRDPDRQG